MRLSDTITKVFTSPTRTNGRIVSRGADGIYIVRTAAGARLRAEAEEIYAPGERVTVFAGRILGRTGGGTTKIFDL